MSLHALPPWLSHSSQKNLHQKNTTTTSPTAPTGAYCLNNASRLMFLACFRYLSDSDLSDVDRWDIPAVLAVYQPRAKKGRRGKGERRERTNGRGSLHAKGGPPCSWS